MDYANDYANMIEITAIGLSAFQRAKLKHNILMSLLIDEIEEGSLEYWIEYNHKQKGIEKYEEWLDEERFEECDMCGFYDVDYCYSSGCQRSQLLLEDEKPPPYE